MSDKTLVVNIPEELLQSAETAHLDLQTVVIRAIELEVARARNAETTRPAFNVPSQQAIEAVVQAALERVATGSTDRSILGLHEGRIRISEDFDAPLPDELWGDLFQ